MEERQVHEKIIIDGKTAFLKEPLLHYTYQSIKDFIKKMQKYSTLSAMEFLKKNPPKYKILKKMIFALPFTFFKMFIIRLGFLDGIRGFILAVFYSFYSFFYSFLKYAKAWERHWR